MAVPQHAAIIDRWIGRLTERSNLTAEEQTALRDLPFFILELPAKREIVGVGETTTECCIVARGLLGRVGVVTGGGRQFTAFYITGDMPDLHSVAVPKVTWGLETIAPSIVLKVPHTAVRRAVTRHPGLGLAFWRECTIDALIGAEWILNIGQRQALGRIAHLYCEMAWRLAGPVQTESFAFVLPLTQQHIADASGTSAVHVNRTVQELRRLGVLSIEHHTVQVHAWTELAAIAEFDPAYLHLPRR